MKCEQVNKHALEECIKIPFSHTTGVQFTLD